MNIDQLKGSFVDAKTVTMDNIEELSVSKNMIGEITAALIGKNTGYEEYVLFDSRYYEGDPIETKFAFFPNAKRGAVRSGGQADFWNFWDWIDCSSMDDLESRWLSIGTDNDT